MSEAMNPYAAPKAVVADVLTNDPGVQPVRLFSAKGRIGRLRYLSYSLAGYLVMVLGAILLGAVAGAAGQASAAGWLGVGAAIPYLVFMVLLTIQRSHDMGWSGWSALLAFIPLVGLIWIINSGTRDKNRFGSPPPPNTTLVKIGGLMFPLILLIGILAAIALPAYKDYTKRAKAAQVVKP